MRGLHTRVNALHCSCWVLLGLTSDESIDIKHSIKCAASSQYIAVSAQGSGLRVFTTAGVLVHIVPDSKISYSISFLPNHPDIISMGFEDGSVRVWDVTTQVHLASFEKHNKRVSCLRFANDGRMFTSSHDKTASITTLNTMY